jgi:hypothetical protein
MGVDFQKAASVAAAQPQPQESNRSLEAFEDYWLLGPSRSLAALAEEYQSSTKPVPTRQLSRLKIWSQQFDWQGRIRKRLAEQALEERRRQQEQLAARQEQVQEDDWQTSERLRAKAKEMLALPIVEKTLVKEVADAEGRVIEQHYIVKPGGWNFQTVVTMFVVASKLSRLATGLSTQNQQLDLHLHDQLALLKQQAESAGIDLAADPILADIFSRAGML